MIRAARPQEIALLPQIESAADQRYARAGLRHVLDMPPAGVAALEQARRDGRLWVAAGPTNRVVGFALVTQPGGATWIDQLSVLERWQGCGLGTALIERCVRQAREQGAAAIYLSTYRDVAWNAPFYGRRGFVPLPRSALPQAFRHQFALENGHGHPPWRRTIMRRALGADYSAATANPICSQVGATSDTVARRMSRA